MHLSSYFSQADLNASDEGKIWKYLQGVKDKTSSKGRENN